MDVFPDMFSSGGPGVASQAIPGETNKQIASTTYDADDYATELLRLDEAITQAQYTIDLKIVDDESEIAEARRQLPVLYRQKQELVKAVKDLKPVSGTRTRENIILAETVCKPDREFYEKNADRSFGGIIISALAMMLSFLTGLFPLVLVRGTACICSTIGAVVFLEFRDRADEKLTGHYRP